MGLNNIIIQINNLKHKNVIISGHERPDLDAFFSGLALTLFLRKLDVNANFFALQRDINALFKEWLDKNNLWDIIITEKDDNKFKETESLFIVDTSSFDRLPEEISKLIINYKKNYIIIDHHNSVYLGDNSYINNKAASTGILVYEIIKKMNYSITKDIADLLYLSILGDTGNFVNTNTTEEVFSIAAELVRNGAVPNELYRFVFARVTKSKLAFLSEFYKSISFFYDDRVALAIIDIQSLSTYNLDRSDVEGLVDFMLSIKGVKASVLIKVESDFIKCSLRSINGINIREIAETFGGGGHNQAAGFSYKGDIEDLKKELLEKLRSVV